ncbi:hypothetical protein ACFSKL_07285 [Belliella marina]|uniref:Uncharacterized protein n=1 Tax=Belliella marina TaxID=1644146 RepID=A0ABW4VKR8_9BACT
MKGRKLSLILLVMIAISRKNDLLAQNHHSTLDNSAGIYMTYEDFERGESMNGFTPYQKNHTIWPQGFFKYKDIELKTPDTTVVYKRSDIWGYKDHKGSLIRVFNNRHYKVLCDRGMIIYIIYSPTRTSYHFSRTLSDEVFHLTKKNLVAAYADSPDLLHRIDSIKKKHWLVWDDRNEYFLLNKLMFQID